MTDKHLPAKVPGTPQEFQKYLFSEDMKYKFQMAVPKWLSVDRLLRVVFSSVLKNPKLLQCTTESLMNAVMQCAQLGLEPILGRAHLIPYKNRKKKGEPLECQFQPGYQGLVDLAERSGKIEAVKAHVVYEYDEFEIEYGLNERLVHCPKMDGSRGKPIGAYTVWTRKSGVKTYSFMLLDDIYRAFRSKSEAYRYAKSQNRTDTPWIEHEPEMLKKSLVKRHSKLEPASVDFMEAVEIDNMSDIGQPSSQAALLENLSNGAIAIEAAAEKLTGKSEPGKDIYATNEVEPEPEKKEADGPSTKETEEEPTKDPVRQLYLGENLKGLTPIKFKKFLKGHVDSIPTMDRKYQDEIVSEHARLFPNQDFPIVMPRDKPPQDKPKVSEKPEETELSDEEKEAKILKLVDRAEKDDTLGVLVPCPNRAEGDLIRAERCDVPVCLYKERPGCPTWVEFDKAQ